MRARLKRLLEARFSGRTAYRNEVWHDLSAYFSQWVAAQGLLDLGRRLTASRQKWDSFRLTMSHGRLLAHLDASDISGLARCVGLVCQTVPRGWKKTYHWITSTGPKRQFTPNNLKLA